jgi:DNA-binding NtrC family response regulator
VLFKLMQHDFPGNVRELENILEHAFVLCRGDLIEMHHMPPEFRGGDEPVTAGAGPMSLKAMEGLDIVDALRRHGGNRRRAAADLGINPSTLYRKMKAMDIEAPAAE